MTNIPGFMIVICSIKVPRSFTPVAAMFLTTEAVVVDLPEENGGGALDIGWHAGHDVSEPSSIDAIRFS